MANQTASSRPVVRVKGLSKRYMRGGIWRKRVPVTAVNDVSFEIAPGETLALVGESGSGKSTVARCVARLEKPDSGQILINGEDIADLGARELVDLRTEVQMVFQDPVTSMNPRFTAAQVAEEPLLIRGLEAGERRDAAAAEVEEVGLAAEWMERPVLEFSGGQRQRLALARALVMRPKVLVLDEALTGLDVSTQAQIANLLLDLQGAHSLAYLLISHDLGLVARMADRIAVMAGGEIVECKATSELMAAPEHEETIRLLTAAQTAQQNLVTATGAGA